MPYPACAGLDDPVIEIAVTPNRGDALAVRGVARDLAAAGLGHAGALVAAAGRGPLPLPDRLADRDPGLPLGARPHRARRAQRPEPGLAAAAAARDRAAADQRAGGHHQLLHPRPRPPAARVRRRPGARRRAHLPARRRRAVPRAERPRLHAGRRRLRHRRRRRRAVPGRRDGRRGHRQHGRHHQRVHRVRAVRPGRRRAHRPPARHRVGRAQPVRARHRPVAAARRAGRRDRHGDRAVRRRAERRGRGRAEPAWQRDATLRFERLQTLGGLAVPPAEAVASLERLGFTVRSRDTTRSPSPCRPGATTSPPRGSGPGAALQPERALAAAAGLPRSRSRRPTWSRRCCACAAWTACRRSRCRHWRRCRWRPTRRARSAPPRPAARWPAAACWNASPSPSSRTTGRRCSAPRRRRCGC